MVDSLALFAVVLALAAAIVKWLRDTRRDFKGDHPRELTPPLPKPLPPAKPVPGFITVLFDKNRPDMVRIVGSTKDNPSPLEKIWRITSTNYPKELERIYDDLSTVRIAGSWYDREATEMYLDHRKGQA